MVSADVIVVGAGVAGACAAETLGRRGYSVILVDSQPRCPPLFRAEKLEPDQIEMLRKLGLFAPLLPQVRRIREIGVGYNGRLFETLPIEQYGIAYSDVVNTLRSHSRSVEHRLGHVEHIANCEELQRVRLRNGEQLTARLVVLSCGVSSDLQAQLGFRKRIIQKEQSLSFGFSIAKSNGDPYPFDAITYFPGICADKIDFLSLFVMGDAMRANLFTFQSGSDPWVRRFINQPRLELERIFPKLARLAGTFDVVTKVDVGRVDLYQMDHTEQPGVVLIGDAFQTACPTTGMGLSKVLTDVDVLCSEHVPRWLATPGMGREKMAAFYNDARKCSVDNSALQKAAYRRRASTDISMRWRIHRLRLHFSMRFRRKACTEKPAVEPFGRGQTSAPNAKSDRDTTVLPVRSQSLPEV